MRLIQLREKVRTRAGIATGDQFITSLVIDDAVNQACNLIDAEYHWPWLEEVQDITTVDGVPDYALPDNYRATRSLVITAPGGGRTVLYSVAPDVALTAAVNSTGLPEAFGVLGDDIILLPTPGGEYTVKHLYYRTTPELIEDGDQPLIPDQWHPAIVAAAVANIATREELRGQKEAADVDVANWIRRMRNALRRNTGPVVPRIRPNGWIS